MWNLFLRLVDKFCEMKCMVAAVPEVTNMPPTESFTRKMCQEWQACCASVVS